MDRELKGEENEKPPSLNGKGAYCPVKDAGLQRDYFPGHCRTTSGSIPLFP